MKKSIALLSTVAAVSLAVMSASASAQSFTFSFTGSGGENGAFGTLNATANGDGTYTATSGTITGFGSVTSGTGSLIANPAAPAATTSSSGFFTYDDQLLPGQSPLISNAGLLFNVNGFEINIFSTGPAQGSYQLYSNSGANVFGNFALSQAAVPEPATWAMMLVGFGMVGAGLRYRRKSTKVSYA